MAQNLYCEHKHRLSVPELVAAPNKILCPICGTVADIKSQVETGGITVGRTLVSKNSAADEPVAELTRSDLTLLSGEVESNPLDQTYGMLNPADSVKSNQAKSESGSNGSGFEKDIATFVPPRPAGYEIIKEIGRGGMGVVYLAREESTGRLVALKTLQRLEPQHLQQFKQEFRALADIAHPNLAAIYVLLSDGNTWCFSMELLEGVEILEYIWSGFDKLDSTADSHLALLTHDKGSRLSLVQLSRIAEAFEQLLAGLHALHKAGKLHSDIKPSNVLLTKEHRLVLLDFGLIGNIYKSGSKHTSGKIRGTPGYMSPEQAVGGSLTAASDMYAVGVVLYEVLTGQMPFRGTVSHVMAQKQKESPTAPIELEPSVPRELNDFCMALLARDPAKRPDTIQALRCFGSNSLADSLLANERASMHGSVQLVGRERHMELLERSFSQVLAGDTLSVFVHGRSGMGKSVLVSKFLDNVRFRYEAVVLEGRCYEQESVPFKTLDSLIDSLADYLDNLIEVQVRALMPRDRLALTRVFPVLGRIQDAKHGSYPSIENADQQELRQRAVNALRELLQRLAIDVPLILYVDDLQWGDVDSADLLADLVRPPDAPRMLLLGSYRSEDIGVSLSLQAVEAAFKKGQHPPHREELAVESLSEDEATQLALMLLGDDDETRQNFARKIARESAGWPFFVWELAQHVQEDPAIGGQTLELDEVIWSRVKRLPAESIRLLELVAVAGRPIPLAEAYLAADSVDKGPSLLAQLRTSNFVRTSDVESGGTSVETYHDRIRESVLSHLDEPTRIGHSLNLAKTIAKASGINVADLQSHIRSTRDYDEPRVPYALEKHQWQRVFDLAFFFDAAGEYERALPYAVVAAEQARAQNALEVAEQQYAIAARGAKTFGDAMQFRVAEGLGDVLTLRGRYDQAEQQYVIAQALTKDNVSLARIDGNLGFLAFKKGDMGKAADFVEKALTALGNPPPGNVLSQTAAILKEVAVQLLHTYFPKWFVGRRRADTEQHRMDLFRARLYDELGYPYWFKKGTASCLWAHLRHMNLAERYPPSRELGRAYAMHAIMMTAIPLAARGAAYAEKSFEIHRDQGDLQGQGKARSFQTFSFIALGRFQDGVESGREAVRLLEQAGDVWEANMARLILSHTLYYLGDLKGSYKEGKLAYEIGQETGDYAAVAIALAFWIFSAPDSLPKGAIEVESQREREDPLCASVLIQARGLDLLLCQDKPAQAADVFQESLDLARKKGLRNPCIFTGVSWKATALRIVAERAGDSATRSRTLRDVKKAVRAALKVTKKYLHCRAHALRERALIAVLTGAEKQARQYFDASLQVAEQQGARYEHAKTLLARAQAGTKFGWADSDQQLIESRAAIAEIEDVGAAEN